VNGPCPTCGETDGFHNDDIHKKVQIPQHLLKPTKSQQRRDRKKGV
jgi:hypothetical protein